MSLAPDCASDSTSRPSGVGRHDLVGAFRRSHGSCAGVPEPLLENALRLIVTRARAAWPEFFVDGETFVGYVGARLPATGHVLERLASTHSEDLYLACACTLGDVRAVERLVATLRPRVERALLNLGVPSAQREDVLSKVQELLLVGDGRTGTPLVATYTGRGTLRGWASSVAVKQAVTARRADRRLVPLGDEALALSADQTSPENACVRASCLEAFRAAFARAMRAAPRRERNLLRQHYLDGMSLEAVARVHRVHRATAARWLAEARENVLRRTRDELAGAASLSPAELDSLLVFVRRQSSFGADPSPIKDALEAR